MKKKINKTLLFVGGGRWAKIWLSELIKKIDWKMGKNMVIRIN